MALSRDVYRELEDILGPENITEDEAILNIYSFQRFLFKKGVDHEYRFYTKFEAITLPGSAEEVQAIIRTCNRRGVKCKASSTGYGPSNTAGSENVILLDLRRMNRILDIDDKNMLMLTEPYVSFAQVQAEAMKRGLGCHVVGAGSQVSWVASHTSVVGNNTMAISQGHSARNLFGAEWVLPSGEIVRLGAPGSGAGWFSGDGPGPSLRGIMRGSFGASGSLGVFTKCAGHLHPWPGPTEIEVKGVSPEYEAVIPPFFEYHILEWPTWEKCADGQYKIGESGIAYAMHKTGGPGSHGACVTGCNNEYYDRRQRGELGIPRTSYSIVLAAGSAREHEYQRKTLEKILEDTTGKISPVGEDPSWKNRDFLTMVRACFIPRLAFRPSGNFDEDGMMGIDTIDHCAYGLKVDEVHRDKWAEKRIIVDDGTINNWAVNYEGGHLALFECGHQYNPLDEDSCKGMMEMVKEGMEKCFKTPFALGWCYYPADLLGPHCSNFHNWVHKTKGVFDPNMTMDFMGYH